MPAGHGIEAGWGEVWLHCVPGTGIHREITGGGIGHEHIKHGRC